MIRWIVGLVTLPIAVASDLMNSGTKQERRNKGDGSNVDPPPGSRASQGGRSRWNKNDIQVDKAIRAGMAIKED